MGQLLTTFGAHLTALPQGASCVPQEKAPYCLYPIRVCRHALARYNAQGPQALGDLRRRNGTSPSVLRPDLLKKLKARLLEPPPDGGLWTSPKVAAWMAGELGRAGSCPNAAGRR